MLDSTRSTVRASDRTRWPITTLLWAWSSVAIASDAPEPTPASDPDPRAFLQALRDAGDASGLRTEALRVGFHTEDALLRADAAYVVGLAEFELGDRNAALHTWWDVERDHAGTDAAARARLAVYALELGTRPADAREGFAKFLAERGDHALAAHARAGVARSYLLQGDFEAAFASVDGASPQLAEALARPRWRRPGVAALMSLVVPGLGQVYTGGYGEAFAALTVNALFAAGSYEAARREQWGTLGVLGFFGLGFYVGNVYGAADGALRHNRRVRQRALDAFDAEQPDPMPGVP